MIIVDQDPITTIIEVPTHQHLEQEAEVLHVVEVIIIQAHLVAEAITRVVVVREAEEVIIHQVHQEVEVVVLAAEAEVDPEAVVAEEDNQLRYTHSNLINL